MKNYWLKFILSVILVCSSNVCTTWSNAISVAQVKEAGSTDTDKLIIEGKALFQKGQYQSALDKYQIALTLARTKGDKKIEVICLNIIGLIYKYLGQYPKALEYLPQSLAISKELGDKQDEGITLNSIGLIYKALGQYPRALEYYQQSLAIRKELGDKQGEGTTLNNIGLIYNFLGQYPRALEYLQQSLAISKELGDKQSEGITLNNIGSIYDLLGQYPRALEYYQQSLAIRKELGDRQGEGITLNNIGLIYKSLGQYPRALEYYQQSLAISKELGSKQVEETSLNNIGGIYKYLGQYPKALEYYQQSLAISKELGNKQSEGTSLNNIGGIYNSLSQYPKALEYYQQSLAIRKKLGDKQGEGNTLNNIGSIYDSQGQYPRALEYYQQSLAIKKELGDRQGEGTTLNNIGLIYDSLGQYLKALEYLQQSLAISKKIGDKQGEGNTLSNIGGTLLEQKKPALAEKSLRAAIAIWENIRNSRDNQGKGLRDSEKISFADTVAQTYQLLQKALIEQNKSQAALEISEQARARALVELLASKINTISSAAQVKLRQAPNLSKIQQIAKQKNSTLVQYSLIEDAIYIWVIAPNGKITFQQSKLPPKTNIKDLVIATRDSIGANRGRRRSKDDNKPSVTSDLKQLHKLLIAPIAKALPTDPNASVIFLPQNDLLIVPFAALQDSQGKYLIEQHTITIAPSIQVLGLTNSSSTKTSGTPLVVGNPIMPPLNGEPLANLPGAEREAQSIGEIIKVQPLIGKAATKTEVIERMQKANLIHLATHGFFIRVEGELPGAVALTNGFLTADEIFDMQLRADLVVLSACDTGRGDVTGDGVVGLSRSLVVAGVPSVIVSLWEVNDAATEVLMKEFYQQLWIKKLPKAQAIRQAMLKTKQEYHNPNSWAAFMLVGEAK
jgi:CHAT domain-containing protein